MKNYLITGAASGIGFYLAEQYNELNRVIGCDINQQSLNQLPEDVLKYKLDVSKLEDWESLFAELERKKIKVDVLVNVAGVLRPGYIHELDPKQIDMHIDINVKGLMYGCQVAAKHMKKNQSGHIINIASLAGIAPIPGLCLYSGSKFAVRGFTLAIASELRPHNIHVGLLSPDAVKTPMLDLQRDYKEAALTFSGGSYLSVADVKKALDKMIKKKKMEMAIPWWRGLLAKIGGFLPELSTLLFPIMNKIGLLKQKIYLDKK